MAEIGASEFDTATAMIGAVGEDRLGHFTGELFDGWDIGGNANGGYLLALAVRAMTAASGRPHPITVTAHYLSPGRPGPVTATTEIVKSGKRFCTVDRCAGRVPTVARSSACSARSATCAPARAIASSCTAEPFDVAPFDECVPRNANSVGVPDGADGAAERTPRPVDRRLPRG